MPSHQERVRRNYTETPVVQPSAHFVCHSCPFEGDEVSMIQHAQDCGHVAVPEDELSRMADEGCPNG